ncbi:MAG: response regulator transcription factor [Aeromicrobium sp.]
MRVIVADDSLLFREGLVRVLNELGFDVVAQAASADDLLQLVAGLDPDLAVVDIRMPPTFTTEGIDAAARLGETHPDLGVVVLSQYVESGFAVQLLEEGDAGRGYLLKDMVGDLDSFAAALRRVGAGGSVVDPGVVSALVGRDRDGGPLGQLSGREREILSLMAEGLSNQGICDRLTLSPRTVESHVRTIFQKFDLGATDDANRRVVAVLTFLREEH